MSYNAKTHKKCSFPKMGNKPLPEKKQKKLRFNEDKSKVMAEWRDGWFKGKYEHPTKLL